MVIGRRAQGEDRRSARALAGVRARVRAFGGALVASNVGKGGAAPAPQGVRARVRALAPKGVRMPAGVPVRRVAATAVVLVVVVGGLVVGWRAWFGTRDATQRTVAELRATRSDLADARDELAVATDDLGSARSRLGDQVTELIDRRDERDEAQTSLDQVTVVLVDARTRLLESQADLDSRETRLEALNTCLVGVAAALNQASVNDLGGLARTVDSIASVCSTAGVDL